MDIKHSRRILVVGAPDSGSLDVVNDLTGSTPQLNENGSTAGLTHEWDIKTAYYSARVPVWVDEISDAEAWKIEFLRPEAKEVVEAVGAWIYCFRKPQDGQVSEEAAEVMKAIQEVSEEHAGFGATTADVVMLAVAVPRTGKASMETKERQHEEWEDVCLENGFEYIDYAGQGTNEFREKTGFERLKEALEANEWAATAGTNEEELDINDLIGLDTDGGMDSFERDEAEMTAELFGVKAALAGDEVDAETDDSGVQSHQGAQVEDLDRMMSKLLAVKEQSADLPEAQRKQMAAKAVRELMGDDNAV